ncbi:MAG: type II and III secretion system family protein, partial [Bdellovibrionales bacterium]
MKIIDFTKQKVSTVLLTGCLAVSLVGLIGCDAAQNQLKPDREASLETQDYRDGLASRIADDLSDDEVDNSNIPGFQPYIASANKDLKAMPLVSLSVNQSVPLRDILFELAKQAEHDLELDPNIKGSIIFTARNRPFDQVVARIADIAGLRYSFEDDVLRVEVDSPYGELYKIDYLSYVRASTSAISNDISVVSGDGTDTGSNFTAESSSEINFWGELETNMEQILGGPSSKGLKTQGDPSIAATTPNPNVETTSGDAVEANVTIGQVPTDSFNTGSSRNSDDGEVPQTFTVNRQAGIVNVFATESTHKEVKRYLDEVRRSVTSQVLIEAKILEVTLNDSYATGVDWRAIDIFGSESVLNFFTGTGVTGLNTLAQGLNETIDGVTSGGSNVQLTVPGVDSGVTTKVFAAGVAGNDIQALI